MTYAATTLAQSPAERPASASRWLGPFTALASMFSAAQRRISLSPKIAISALMAAMVTLFLLGAQPYLPANMRAVSSDALGDKAPPKHDQTDSDLYREVIDKVTHGQNYYDAVAQSHRKLEYPLHPFVAVRLPTLAWFWALGGHQWAQFWVLVLSFATLLAWRHRIAAENQAKTSGNQLERVAAMILTFSGLTLAFDPDAYALHEFWAGLIMAISLACFKPERASVALVLAFIAAIVRETAVPLLLLLTIWLAFRQQWRSAGLGAAMILLFVGVMLVHKHAVEAIPPLPGDMTSEGWSNAGGWTYYIDYVRQTTFLRMFTGWATVILVPLALLGWLGRNTETGRLMGCFHLGFALFFMLFGRANNFYWSLLVAPTLLIGLAFLPRTLADLYRLWRSTPDAQPLEKQFAPV